MENQMPELTRNMIRFMQETTEKYSVSLDGVNLSVFPGVFPPVSPFSRSSDVIFPNYNLNGKSVLDLGTGTGILAIKAALAGARLVHAVDVNDTALECAKHNVELNGLLDRVNFYKSDLFSNIPYKYDYILANLPILDFHVADFNSISLIDPDFSLHRRFFKECSNHLFLNGEAFLSHIDFVSCGFSSLEGLALQNNLNWKIIKSVYNCGHEFRGYSFFKEKK